MELACLWGLYTALEVSLLAISLANNAQGRMTTFSMPAIVDCMNAGSAAVASGFATMELFGTVMSVASRGCFPLAAHVWLCIMCYMMPTPMAYTLWLAPTVDDLQPFAFSARDIVPLIFALPQDNEGEAALFANLNSFTQSIA